MTTIDQNEAPQNETLGTAPEQQEELGVGEVIEPKAPIADKLEAFDSRGDIFAKAQAASREKPKTNHEEVQSMFKAPTILDFSPELQARYEKLGSSGKAALDNLLTYVREMRPRMPVEAKDRYRYQSMLYSTLRNVIKHSDGEFRKNMTAVLRFFREFNNPTTETALGDRYIHRDLSQVPMSAQSLKQFPLLVEMFKALAEADKRENFLSIRNKEGRYFDHILRFDFTSDDIERVKGYFSR